MTKHEIWIAYRKCEMSYETALEKLEALGMSEGAADDLLGCKLSGEDDPT